MGLVVEGATDRIAVERIFADTAATVDPARVVVTNGKTRFDARIQSFNEAARHGAWFALRDLDYDDAGSCAVALRQTLLKAPQHPGLCLRIASRTLEAWLLADTEAVSSFFQVPSSRVPRKPDELDWPEETLVHLCRSSARRDVRRGTVPPRNAQGTGPEYTRFVTGFCAEARRPSVAAEQSPTLARSLAEIRATIEGGSW